MTNYLMEKIVFFRSTRIVAGFQFIVHNLSAHETIYWYNTFTNVYNVYEIAVEPSDTTTNHARSLRFSQKF